MVHIKSATQNTTYFEYNCVLKRIHTERRCIGPKPTYHKGFGMKKGLAEDSQQGPKRSQRDSANKHVKTIENIDIQAY